MVGGADGDPVFGGMGGAGAVTDHDGELVGGNQLEKVAHDEAAELAGGSGDNDHVGGLLAKGET
ncbi:hypothetical protein Areg01_33400 [Actinoplanes regularis]|nr:hypothetical protein Areg01_33400 [Actinoplanes regularis]